MSLLFFFLLYWFWLLYGINKLVWFCIRFVFLFVEILVMEVVFKYYFVLVLYFKFSFFLLVYSIFKFNIGKKSSLFDF